MPRTSVGKDEIENQIQNPEVAQSEIAFITSINVSSRTFFAQFCKYSNQELLFVNQTINDHCKKISTVSNFNENQLKSFRTGELVCARYSRDGFWYRGWILKKIKEESKFQIFYVDYGNIENVSVQEVLRVEDLPLLYRAPFGVACYYTRGEKFDGIQWLKFLESISNQYVLLNMQRQMSNIQWEVEIPLHGYNMPFLRNFMPQRFNCDTGKYRFPSNRTKNVSEDGSQIRTEIENLVNLVQNSLNVSINSDS